MYDLKWPFDVNVPGKISLFFFFFFDRVVLDSGELPHLLGLRDGSGQKCMSVLPFHSEAQLISLYR